MDVALEAGAEDVETADDGSIEVTTAWEDFSAVKAALADAGLAPERRGDDGCRRPRCPSMPVAPRR
jgi:transcriptional/translational regulatory protein YebC/TACO1